LRTAFLGIRYGVVGVVRRSVIGRLRIPGDADQRSGLMPIAIPK
jgi:hypothetical protein